jgi:uncharacterized protein
MRLLAGAGVISGALNAAAGGGSLISFPALLVVGYPPLLANVTTNVAAWPGYVGGAWGYRRELAGQATRMLLLAPVCAVGGVFGVLLVRISSQSAFSTIVPFLVLAACALLTIEPLISRYRVRGQAGKNPGVGAYLGQAAASVYGGYFSAALGVAVLAVLGLTLRDTLQRLNALKAVLQLVIGTASAVSFALLTPVAWRAALVVGLASLVGGQAGASLARKVEDRTLRVGIITYGLVAAVWLFFRA